MIIIGQREREKEWPNKEISYMQRPDLFFDIYCREGNEGGSESQGIFFLFILQNETKKTDIDMNIVYDNNFFFRKRKSKMM